MFFASDNTGPAHPQVMQALLDANTGYASAYGTDDLMDRVRAKLREVFEAPEAAVFLVATGTAANSLALATMCTPWQTVFCSPVAHIHEDECNAPEFYSGGAKLTLVGDSDKIAPDALRAAILAEETRGVHGPQRGPVSITQATEKGQVYSCEEIAELSSIAAEYELPLHLDGARFANALVTLGCMPAEMTWKAGVDAVSFGATKNGCPGVEAVIFFNPKHGWEFELRRKRGAHLFSKHRYLSAQMLAYLGDDLWLNSARAANQNRARLEAGLRQIPNTGFAYEPQANIIFATLPRAVHERLKAAGAQYHVYDEGVEANDPDEPILIRLVCDWSLDPSEIDRFLDIAKS